MTSESQLPNLHDAILLRIVVDWANAVATIELERLPGVPVVLLASELREFSMTHRQEWGPSISVNSADLQSNEAGESALAIEMQSGDNVRLIASRVDVS